MTHERDSGHADLRASEQRYRLLFENMTTGFALHEIICDAQGRPIDYRFLEVNPAFERLTGVSATRVVGRTLLEVMPETEKYWIETFGRVALTGQPVAYENFSREIGRSFDTWVFSPQPGQFAVIFSDITERKRAETEVATLAERLDLATRSAGIGIWDWDIANDRLTWDNRMFELYGLDSEGFSGAYEAWASAVHPDDRAFAEEAIASALRGDTGYDIQFRVLRSDESVRHIKADGHVVRDEQGNPLRMLGTNYDVTERVRAEEQLEFMAHHDLLTGLANRAHFISRLEGVIERAQRSGDSAAVFFMDLDRFKNINDTFGHFTGDRLLQRIGECLQREISETETVARLGGDEFAVIVESVRGAADALDAANRILLALDRPFAVDGHDFFVTTSIGISFFPADGTDPEALLKYADTAMYRAKELGGNSPRLYSAELSDRAAERLVLERDLRRALERGEFALEYQPQVDMKTERPIGMEALVRWDHPAHGRVPPDRFIALAEETGLINPIGGWVLHSACALLRKWCDEGREVLPVTVNLSGRQFMDGSLAGLVSDVLATTGLDPRLLELEITEGIMMHNPENAIRTLTELNAMGVQVALDDFGTGYSSLSYVKRFPIGTLKIDKSFVHDVTTDENDASIVVAIIGMAHGLGLRVIAEGVETEAQRAFLGEHGCDAIQGFLHAAPMGADAMREYLDAPGCGSGPARRRPRGGAAYD